MTAGRGVQMALVWNRVFVLDWNIPLPITSPLSPEMQCLGFALTAEAQRAKNLALSLSLSLSLSLIDIFFGW